MFVKFCFVTKNILEFSDPTTEEKDREDNVNGQILGTSISVSLHYSNYKYLMAIFAYAT